MWIVLHEYDRQIRDCFWSLRRVSNVFTVLIHFVCIYLVTCCLSMNILALRKAVRIVTPHTQVDEDLEILDELDRENDDE